MAKRDGSPRVPVKRKKSTVKGLSPKQDKALHRYLTNGFKKNEALHYAGFADSVCRGPATIFESPKFKAELDSRLRRLRTKYAYTEELVLEEIAKLAFANLSNYMTIDRNTGEGIIDLKWVTHEELAALGEYTVDTYFEGRGDDAVQVKKARVKLAGKLDALEKLMKYHGAYRKNAAQADGDNDVVAILMSARKRVGEQSDGEAS